MMRAAHHSTPRASIARPGDLVQQGVDGRNKSGHDGVADVHRLRTWILVDA